MNQIRKYFPIFENIPELVYLDNAATTQKPKVLLDALAEYYFNYNSNVGRGSYKLAELSESKYEYGKTFVKKFLKAENYACIYTTGSTESLNISAKIAIQNQKKKYIIIPFVEHHANILIWQEIAKLGQFEIYWIKDAEMLLDPTLIPNEIKENIAIITITHVSNVTGEVFPIEKWVTFAKKIEALSIVDGSQSVTSLKISLDDIDCDFFCFSAHKLYGPMGLGVMLMNKRFINYNPIKLGGGIIEDVNYTGHQLIDGLQKFDAGTPNVANAYAFSKTLEWLYSNGWEKLLENTHALNIYLQEELSKTNISAIHVSKNTQNTHIVAFNLPKIHPHDVGTFLAQKNIAVRVGKHCAYPLHEKLNLNSSIRASVGIYNEKEDIDRLIVALKECIAYFKE